MPTRTGSVSSMTVRGRRIPRPIRFPCPCRWRPLRMPCRRRTFPVGGLLPDNNEILRRWGQRFHVSPRNPFRLLTHVGEDCAGAVQLVKPETLSDYLAGSAEGQRGLADGRGDRRPAWNCCSGMKAFGAPGTTPGSSALAGAQPKSAFYYDPRKQRWGVPSGAIPTTHIFKPAKGTLTDTRRTSTSACDWRRNWGFRPHPPAFSTSRTSP